MHELSLAMGILDSVSEQAAKRGIERVSVVSLRVGAMSGVVRDSLRFSWELACADTVAAGVTTTARSIVPGASLTLL